jgi:mevalonate kinase
MSNQTKQTQLFNQLLLQAIDDVLASMGSSTKNSIYLCLSNRKGINREQIPQRINDFHETLESILGEKGVMLIESRILELLEARMRVNCTVKLAGASVGECVVFLCQHFENANVL